MVWLSKLFFYDCQVSKAIQPPTVHLYAIWMLTCVSATKLDLYVRCSAVAIILLLHDVQLVPGYTAPSYRALVQLIYRSLFLGHCLLCPMLDFLELPDPDKWDAIMWWNDAVQWLCLEIRFNFLYYCYTVLPFLLMVAATPLFLYKNLKRFNIKWFFYYASFLLIGSWITISLLWVPTMSAVVFSSCNPTSPHDGLTYSKQKIQQRDIFCPSTRKRKAILKLVFSQVFVTYFINSL